MTCRECLKGSATYKMKCIGCMARWILRFEKKDRLKMIETNGRHDVEALKAEIIKRGKK